jgi:ribosomal protein L40E
MPKEELGYVELEWTCKNCGTRNPGTLKNCRACGAPMGSEGKFELPAQQALITDAEKLKAAGAGPDVECPFCGTRNSASAKSCKQCGGDLTGGKARFKGGVLGAFDDSPQPEVKCQNCGSLNPASAVKCSNCGASLKRPELQPAPAPQSLARPAGISPLMIAGVVGLLILCAAGAYFLFARTSELVGTVAGVTWQRSIAIMAQVPVRDAEWREQLPADANIVSCELKPRRFSDVQEPNSVQVCGTPYVVDQGDGTGKVVRDCQYQVSEQYCSYTRLQWSVINTVSSRGTDLQPNWPLFSLATGEREGNRAEEYRVLFDAGGKQYSYTPSNASDFARFPRGSRWNLTVNGIGAITDLKPAQ